MLGTHDIVRLALQEDVGPGDITTAATVPSSATCRARIIARHDGILSGITIAQAVFQEAGAQYTQWTGLNNGDAYTSGQTIAEFTANTRGALTGERVALNYLQRLSAIATLTRSYIDAVSGTNARIVDTRKTTPLMRAFEKDAVLHGGGHNHRFGLFDAVLIKENHIEAAGGVAQAISAARDAASHMTKVEVEVRSFDELREALAANPDVIMLDNMDATQIAEAVTIRGAQPVLLEASGNMTPALAQAAARAGADIISVGALTHSAPAADLSLLIEALHG